MFPKSRLAAALTVLAIAAFVPRPMISIPATAQVFVDTPDLAVRLRAPKGGCAVGRRCHFFTFVANRGTEGFNAPISIRHYALPSRLLFLDANPGQWSCGSGGDRLRCTGRYEFLGTDQQTRYSVNVYVPKDITRQKLQVCGAIDWSAVSAMKEKNRLIQRMLNSEGYDAGKADGIVGQRTQAAIARMQADEGLPVTGQADNLFMREIFGDWGIGDASSDNDRGCVRVALYDTGQYQEEPLLEQLSDDTDSEPAPINIELSCSTKRIQQGSACVCRPELVENEIGECIDKNPTKPGTFCENNMILNEKGECQCYLNLKNREGKCLAKVRAKCLPGEILNIRGKCECPKDRKIVDAKCVLP